MKKNSRPGKRNREGRNQKKKQEDNLFEKIVQTGGGFTKNSRKKIPKPSEKM